MKLLTRTFLAVALFLPTLTSFSPPSGSHLKLKGGVGGKYGGETRRSFKSPPLSPSLLPKQPSSTSLHAALPLKLIFGGLLSGGFHAITGPDHLAALLPRTLNRPFLPSSRVGLLWGLGHGVSVLMLGLCMWFMKTASGLDTYFLRLGKGLEVLVGLSLVLIGYLGYTESTQSLSSSSTPTSSLSTRAILLNGLLHGFSLDGAPSLAPSLAAGGLVNSLYFLVFYAVGTAVSMGVAMGVVGEGTRRLGEKKGGKVGVRISKGSSLIAVVVGVVWVWLGLRA
ncbi:hypothetical protein TL16_g01509 [Triparma laevis f. inornata]|uniref:Urease accessory protein UreH-like transmembrane domain-containing protein n=2 Tax=Triparma laevis TaxID=1534972 RepID=A0A9W7FPT6_9STRA|nr:hypothetical protein TL16_g01509 [Triparma laevis f. inornata]GMI16687.1 hypothetical protein TrLO_g10848 [Triparma laevis f. longispina]